MLVEVSKKRLKKLFYLRVGEGEMLLTVAEKMADRANLLGARVTCIFCDIQIIASPGMSAIEICMQFSAKNNRRFKKWCRTMPGELHRRELQAEIDRQNAYHQHIQDVLDHDKMQIVWYKRLGFLKLMKNVEQRNVVLPIVAWMTAMQPPIKAGKRIDEAVDMIPESDFGINFDNYPHRHNMIVVAGFWRYGRQLLHWWRAETSPET